jgi:hypothetical protein
VGVGSAVSRAIDEISKQISLIWSSLFILLHGTNHQVAELQKAHPAPPQASQEANPSRTTHSTGAARASCDRVVTGDLSSSMRQ